MDLKKYWVKLKTFLKECKRVLKITKKPTKDEFQMIVKICAIGMALIGVIGFIITIAATLLGI